jgi:3-oxoadipate enol-lactonase
MVPVEGTELFVREVGSGPAIVFVHGMCGDADAWADQQARLSDRFRCVAYDRRGHTRSPFGDGVRTVEAHADDVAALIRAMSLEPVLLVGSSGGARIGVDVARRFPELLRGAVLSEPALIALSEDGGAGFVARLRPALEAAPTPQAAVDAFFTEVDPRLWRGLPEERKDAFRANHVELFGDLQMPAYAPADEDLAAIGVPIRLLRGSDSEPIFGEIVGHVARAIPAADVVVLDGATHATYASAPEAFADAVASFADAHP